MFLTELLGLNYFSASVLCIAVVLFLVKWFSSGFKLPPGPWGLPILGYLPYLSENLHLDFMKIAEKYGNIFSLKIGVRTAVVLHDFEMIKEAFHREDISLKSPDMFELSGGVKNITDHEGWKDWRRFILTSLRNLGMGKNKLQDAMEKEVQDAMHRFSQSRGDVNLHEIVYPAVNSIIISMICGKRLTEDSAFSKVVDAFSKNTLRVWNVKVYLYYLPFLKPFESFLLRNYKEARKIMDYMTKHTSEEILSHEKELGDGPPEDFIEHYLKGIGSTEDKKPYFNRDHLNGNSQVLLIAGNDTSLSTIEWVLMTLADRQDIQERAYQEIISVFGKERIPTIEDKERLPYLDAVLAESSRLHTIVPYSVPHLTSQDTKIREYEVPKDSMVFINLYAIHRDPKLWNNPEEFNPDRFLTADGKRIKDPEYLIPFGIGKRLCVGEKLAREEVFVFVSATLQRFKLLPPSRGLSFESETALVVHPKYPFVRIQQRT